MGVSMKIALHKQQSTSLRQRTKEWLASRIARSSSTLARALGRGKRDTVPVTLDRHRVFILPTAYGLGFATLLLLILLGSLNYNNNMGLALCFWLGAIGLVSILHTYRNLAELSLSPGRVEPVFAGQQVEFPVCLANHNAFARSALTLRSADGHEVHTDVPATTSRCVVLTRSAHARGHLPLGNFRITTCFPLGLFRAWSALDLGLEGLVYPLPAPPNPLPTNLRGVGDDGLATNTGVDDFAGFRLYQPGDPTRQIHWKGMAREQQPHSKVFTSLRGTDLWLDWDSLGNLDTEAKLSRLCRWVLDAEAGGLRYGLRLPSLDIPPDHGPGHRHRCLKALALYSPT